MPITRARSVADLYDECRDFDLVLVPDPPLASALNRRLERPHFGPFATTPRRLAAGRRETAEDRTAFLRVITETDLDWKEAAYVIGNVLQCWEHEGRPEAILEYEAYATPATTAVLEIMRELPTTSNRLDDYRIPSETSVAVVGLEEFTTLERSILPAAYHEVDPFTIEPFEHPPFRLYDSPAAIVDTILETVTQANADRVAIVLDRAGEFSPLVESALEAADIPFYGGPGFNDDPNHRAFLRLLRVAHAGSGLRIADVRPVLEALDLAVSVEDDEKRLAAVDRPGLRWLTTFCSSIDDRSFAAALDAFEAQAGVDLPDFRAELGELGILEEPVTQANVDRLTFYLRTYEVPVERHNEGVLLADAKAAATVDRPAVFYLGMDERWTHHAPRRPWVDRDVEFTKHLKQFQRLLQNGAEQYYLVQDERAGRAVTPCLYFEALLDEPFERFSDLASEPQARTFQPTRDGFERAPLDLDPDSVETLSQSGLNTLVNCPRDFLFGRLVDGPDRDYFAVGNLFHDFAEVYVNHHEAIDAAAMDDVVEFMLASTAAFDRDVDRGLHRTRYRIGLETIVSFLDANPPEGAGFLVGNRGWWSNAVADHLGLTVDSPLTEWWFAEADLGLKGKIDLVRSPAELLDYKSGRKHTVREVVRDGALDPPSETPNFQALAYLSYLRTKNPDSRLSFAFFHFLETLDDVLSGEADLAECLTTIRYEPVAFEDYLARVSVFEALCEDGPGACRKTFAQVDYEDYAAVADGNGFPETRDSEELLESAFGQALHRRARAAVGDYQYVETGCAQALRYLRDIRDATLFADDLDAFEAFVTDRLDEVNRWRVGEERFPIDGLGGEPNWRRVDHRDMILEGGG